MITLDGSAVTGNVSLTGNSKANKIYGGSGNDTLWGGAGNDTLTGNAGSDTFIYTAGKDVVTDFNAATDKISIEGGVEAITNATFSGTASETLILTINKQTLKIQSADGTSLANTEITVNDAVYTFDKNLISDGTSVTMYSAFKGAYTAASDIITVDGSAYKFDKNQISTADGKSVSMYSAFKGAYTSTNATNIDGSAANGAMNITGTGNADTIYGGKKADTLSGGIGADSIEGGAGNDSIYGGAGNDTLTGGAGKDIFNFKANEGADTITDYTEGQDKIKMLEGTSISGSHESSNGNWTFEFEGGGSVIVLGGAGKKITIVEANGRTTTQLYGEDTSSNSRTLDLLYDNNFMTDDAALDDITEAKYSVTDIEEDNKDELEKAQALLTYSEDK